MERLKGNASVSLGRAIQILAELNPDLIRLRFYTLAIFVLISMNYNFSNLLFSSAFLD